MKAITKLGGKCAICGFSDERALQIDHIKGGGIQDVKKHGNHYTMYKHILENPDGYQVLCANCNWIKRHRNHELPSGPRPEKQKQKKERGKASDGFYSVKR